MTEITFFISLTPSYLHFLPNLLISIEKSFPSFRIVLLIVSPSSLELATIKCVINSLNIESFTSLIVDNYQAFSYADLRGYIANQRASMLYEGLFLNTSYICYVDVNTIFLPSFREIYINNSKFDAAIIFDESHSTIKACNLSLRRSFELASSYKFRRHVGPLGSILIGSSLSGLQLYKVSEKLKCYLGEYRSLIANSNSWFASQEALSILYLKFRNILSFVIINECDIGMADVLTSRPIAIYRKKGREALYDEFILHQNPIFQNLDQDLLGGDNPLLPRHRIGANWLKVLNGKLGKIVPLIIKSLALRAITKVLLVCNSKEYFISLINLDNSERTKYKIIFSTLYPTTRGIYEGILFEEFSILFIFKITIIAFPIKLSKDLERGHEGKIISL